MIILIIGFFVFIAGLVYSVVFKVPDVYLGLPSSLFLGRIEREVDVDGFSLPIRKPYKEGFHFKKPWWTIAPISREVSTKVIEKRVYQVKEGSVLVSGVIQYRPSSISLYRFEEVNAKAIDEGLDSELDQIVSKVLVESDVETAVTRKSELSEQLIDRLAGAIIYPGNTAKEKIRRSLFGKELSYAEHSYGIEILKASIDTVDPSEDIKIARDAQAKESYEKISQTTEWNHLMGRMGDLQKKFPEISDEEALKAVQVWQGQAGKQIHEIKVSDLEKILKGLPTIKNIFTK